MRNLLCIVITVAAVLVCAGPALAAETYSYDAAGRLTKVVYADTSWVEYTYDKNGNITSIANHPHPTTAVNDGRVMPAGLSIEDIAPNPTGTDATVRYRVNTHARVTLAITDMLGRETLVMEKAVAPGTNRALLPTRQLQPGVYLCTVRAGVMMDKKKIVVLR